MASADDTDRTGRGPDERGPGRRRGLPAVVATGVVAVIVAAAALTWPGVSGAVPTGRIGRIEPPIAAPISVADIDSLAAIHTDSMNALRKCVDDRRGTVARAGGDSHLPVYC